MECAESEERLSYDSEGITLCAMFSRQRGKCFRGNILLVHGIINDKDEDGNFVKLAREFNEIGYNVLRFDFRGHGESEGRSEDVTVAGEVKDLENSIRKFDELVRTRPKYILIASSFGAIASILYASSHSERIEKMVLWNPVLDFEKTFLRAETPWGKTFFNEKGYTELRTKGYITVPNTDFRFGKRLIDEFGRIKPYELLARLEMPILTIHGTEDTAVPYSVSEKYGKPNDRSKFISHKSDHSFVGIEDTAIDETVRWVIENDCKKSGV